MRSMTRAFCATLLTLLPMGAAQAADTYLAQVDSYQRDGNANPYATASTALQNDWVSVSQSGKTSSLLMAVAKQDSLKTYATASGASGMLTAPAGINGITTATWQHDVTPNQSGAITSNGYAAWDMTLVDPMDLATRAAMIDVNDPTVTSLPEGFGIAFEVSTTAIYRLSLADLTSGGFDEVYARYDLYRQITLHKDFNSGQWSVDPTGDTVGSYYRQTFDANGYDYIGDSSTGNTVNFAKNFHIDSVLDATHNYAIEMNLQCWSSLRSLQGTLDGLSATCDGSHSAYWNGVTNAPAGFALNGSGQNFLYSSSLSPAPLVPGVPEPAQWALLLTGFGLLGAGARRRGVATA